MTYMLNTRPFFICAKHKPTILPSERPHMINEPSEEMVRQSIFSGKASTFVFWLLPLIKSLSNKYNILSIATTTCSFRKVARTFGSLIWKYTFKICSQNKTNQKCVGAYCACITTAYLNESVHREIVIKHFISWQYSNFIPHTFK